MNDFLERFTQVLKLAAGSDVALHPGSKNELLDVARLVAHNSERKNTPLATFVIGRYVEARVRAGVDPATALNEAIEAARGLLDTHRREDEPPLR